MSTTERCPNCFGELPMDPCRHCGWRRGGTVEPFYLAPGTLLDGRYRIGRVLGYGGFGVTYLAWDENLDVRLAIKEYLPRDLSTRAGGKPAVIVFSGEAESAYADGLTRFQEEARILAHFQQHPGIVSVYNFFLAHSTGYMVMEYVDGSTLKTYLERKGSLAYETTRKVLLPVMGALCAVHVEGLLHRDIAPDNIYITRDRRVKLLDFGAARFAIGEHSRSLSVVLKPGYAPEEQYRSRGHQGPWTDIYALAATFYRCLTGEKPPDALDRLEHDGLLTPSSFGIALPAEAEQMLLKGLAVKAADRPADMATFREPFQQRSGPRVTVRASAPALSPESDGLDPVSEITTSTPAAYEPPATPPQKGGGGIGPTQGQPPHRRGQEGPRAGVSGIKAAAQWLMRSTGLHGSPLPSDPQEQFTLGRRYQLGNGVRSDDARAAVWLRKAAEQGHVEAQFSLGLAYSEGRGVPQDDTQAVVWWCRAAEQGDAEAQFMFGVMYSGGRGVPQNDTQAAVWYRKAAEQGHGWAQVSLGVLFTEGRGVPKDQAQAVAWYRRAAAGSDPEAVRRARSALAQLGLPG
jgi:serine/threonine protein kinase